MNREEIEKILPHRDNMLLLDEELNLKATFIDGELVNGSL